MSKARFLSTLVFFVAVMVVRLPAAFAYETFSTGVDDQGNCAQCHGAFKGDPYDSLGEGILWPKNLHDMHLDNTDVESNPNGSCDNCHGGAGTSGREVKLDDSGNAKDGVNAIGCMGCHGRLEDGLDNIGAGLRSHHLGADSYINWPGGIPSGLTCAICHGGDPATPASENTPPPWYATVTNTSILKSMSTCSLDGEEDFSSNGTGIDNDGDGVYDALDSDCDIPIQMDITGLADTSGDGVPDLAAFVAESGVKPAAKLYSGANGDNFGTLNFLNPDWQGIAIDTVDDANGDGAADDPGVAMLLIETATDKMMVQVRDASTGTSINKINFLNPDWTPVDVVVFNDTNGDGNPNDASIGVLAVNKTTGKILVQVRLLSNGSKIAARSFLNLNWTPIAAASAERAGQTPLLAILGVESGTDKILVQTRQLSDGVLIDNAKYLSTMYTASDIATIRDGNSDGIANDPAWVVLANENGTDKTQVQARFAATGAKIDDINYLTSDYLGKRLANSGDISGNNREEVSVLAEDQTDGDLIIQIRDFDNESKTGNVFP